MQSIALRSLALFAVLAVVSTRAGASPQIVRVDGSVYDNSGTPLTADRDVQIKAYNAASGGTLLWTSKVYAATMTNGRFSLSLDAADTSVSSPSLSTRVSLLGSSSSLWLEVHYDTGSSGNGTMDSDQTVLPRFRARGTIFAAVAASADTLTGVTVALPAMLNGMTSNVQTQINILNTGIANGITTATLNAATVNVSGLSGGFVPVTDGAKNLVSSSTSTQELAYLQGTTSGLQGQLNSLNTGLAGKQATLTPGNITSSTSQLTITNGSASTVGPNVSLTVATAATGATGLLSSIDWNTFNGKQAALGFTPVNKAGDTLSGGLILSAGNLVASAGQFASALTDTAAFTCASTNIDFNNGNVQTLSASVAAGSCTVNLVNMVDGGSYTIVMKGSASTNAVTYSFSHAGVSTWKFSPTNSATIAGKETVYSFLKIGSTVYVNWVWGY